MKKYEITYIQHPSYPNLFRIRALHSIPRSGVGEGDLGGYIEHEGNLSQENNCWVGDDACVYGNAYVCGNAYVFESAQVFGDAVLNEQMLISSHCVINTTAQIYYSDGVTAFLDKHENLIVNGTSHNIELHKTLTRLKLA